MRHDIVVRVSKNEFGRVTRPRQDPEGRDAACDSSRGLEEVSPGGLLHGVPSLALMSFGLLSADNTLVADFVPADVNLLNAPSRGVML
jgi:hypothetical protein